MNLSSQPDGLLCVKNCPCLFVNRTTNCMDVFYISSYIEIAI